MASFSAFKVTFDISASIIQIRRLRLYIHYSEVSLYYFFNILIFSFGSNKNKYLSIRPPNKLALQRPVFYVKSWYLAS